VVNLQARRGSEAVARRVERTIPGARVVRTRSLEDVGAFARSLDGHEPPVILSAGGDGSAVALIDAIHAAPLRLGVLPLGTGNAWAHATGAGPWRGAVDKLAAHLADHRDVPLRRFDLVESFGTQAHFAGTGWDAEIIDDFYAQKDGPGVLPSRWRNGLAGYLHGVFTRTIPRHLRQPPPEVELINTGSPAMIVGPDGRPALLPGGDTGAVLYRGPASVCAAGTTPSWGFGFQAFPAAGLVPGRFCMRVYSGTVLQATFRMRTLWRGQPVAGMYTWLLDACRATFSRPVPFQVAGDRRGSHTVVDYKIAPRSVELVDWRRMN
jgi:hypothetical protein